MYPNLICLKFDGLAEAIFAPTATRQCGPAHPWTALVRGCSCGAALVRGGCSSCTCVPRRVRPSSGVALPLVRCVPCHDAPALDARGCRCVRGGVEQRSGGCLQDRPVVGGSAPPGRWPTCWWRGREAQPRGETERCGPGSGDLLRECWSAGRGNFNSVHATGGDGTWPSMGRHAGGLSWDARRARGGFVVFRTGFGAEYNPCDGGSFC